MRRRKKFPHLFDLSSSYIARTQHGKIISETAFENCVQLMLKEAGITKPISGLHFTRHTFATRALKKGIECKQVSQWLGHKHESTTRNFYYHLLDQDKVDAVEALEAM